MIEMELLESQIATYQATIDCQTNPLKASKGHLKHEELAFAYTELGRIHRLMFEVRWLEEQAYKTDRYGMIIAHANRCNGTLRITELERVDVFYKVYDVACETCKWWDHWDERK